MSDDTREKLLDTPIVNCKPIPSRIRTAMGIGGYRSDRESDLKVTLRDLCAKTPTELMAHKNTGRGSVSQTINYLRSVGLKLADDPAWDEVAGIRYYVISGDKILFGPSDDREAAIGKSRELAGGAPGMTFYVAKAFRAVTSGELREVEL